MSTTKATPALFYVHTPIHKDDQPTGYMELLALVVGDQPFEAGVSLPEAAVDERAIDWDSQVAALQWCMATGVVELLYVTPQWRRQGIAKELFDRTQRLTGELGLPGIVMAPVRTALGEVWVKATGAPAEPLTDLSGPMTPPEETWGITDRRLLIPDDPDALLSVAEAFAAGAVRKTVDTACGPATGVPLHKWNQ